jgi:hypothetical protein
MISVEIWDRTRGTYRKVSMKQEFMRTTLESKIVCPCGYPFLKEEIQIGTEYTADLGTCRHAIMNCGGCGERSTIAVVNVLDEATGKFWPCALSILELRHIVRVPNVTIH